jgi:opacity protein-like surface antigen
MRKFLVVGAFALGALAFATSAAGARTGIGGNVPLTSGQVHTVCSGKDFCEKSCGLNGEYTCGFGCGSKGCSGSL